MPSKRFQALVLENYVREGYMKDVLPSDLDDARSIVEASATRARRTPTKFDGDIFDTIFEGEEIMSHF